MSAHFSATITTGAIVCAPTISGKTEASHTRSPRTPCTRSCASTTLSAARGPMRHVDV